MSIGSHLRQSSRNTAVTGHEEPCRARVFGHDGRMHLSAKADYAARALLELHAPGPPVDL
ncbi:hypothetical protein [Streptomyces sp. KL116D]|uniref:hypothetical protein n=1 Tax=Streptomyces sp. KL116D TaxID=3045152 RepID=UPI003555EEF4